MKGSIRIAGALILGVVIVLGALYASTQGTVGGQEGSIVSATNYERDYIESRDSDGDGIKDWEENLQARFIQTIDTATTSPESAEYTPPETFTGKFSEAFLQDYLQGKMDGQDFSDPTAFLENAVTVINQNTLSPRHSRLEITVTPATAENMRMYGDELSTILKTHSIQNENEAVILARALEANDPTLLHALAPIRDVYAYTIDDALAMSVPDELADEHVNLLNALESIKTDIEAMQMAFTDPLYTMARVRTYEQDGSALYKAFQAIGKALAEKDVSYSSGEPGAFFYLFDI